MEAKKLNIKDLLKQKGVRHDYFAKEIVQVTPATLSRWIAGTSRPPKLKIDIISDYFDIDGDDLDIKEK